VGSPPVVAVGGRSWTQCYASSRSRSRPSPLRAAQPSDLGQNLIEFALIVPVLILLVFGIVDLGRVFYSSIALENAAREAARYLAANPVDRLVPTAVAIAQGEASANGIAAVTVVIVTPIPAEGPISVSVRVDYSFLTGDVLGIGGGMSIGGSAEMLPLRVVKGGTVVP